MKHLISSVLAACLLALPAMAAEPLVSRGEVSVKGGSDRSLLTTEFWTPIAQESDRVLYGDIRLMGDNDENREGNLGIGYRQIKGKAVLGAHGWIDRSRTQNGSTFHQMTFGVERLGHIVDVRANTYIPLNQSRNIVTPNLGSTVPYLSGTGIYYDTNGILTETPQYGVDGEIGFRLPVLQKKIDAIRFYGGGYHFFRNETENVTGYRVRGEVQLNRAISIGARFQHDEPRGSQSFLEATLKFPFSAKKLYQTDSLRSRLDESPERDVDIVTAARQTDTGLRKEIINTTTGQTQRVIHVDNSNAQPGDGTKENPFNTLKSAEAALQDNDVLYVNHGTGNSTGMDQGIIINRNNIQMIGSGSNFVYDSGKFTTYGTQQPVSGTIIAAASFAPVITNMQTRTLEDNGVGILVTADNAMISGVSVNGSRGNGIMVQASGAGHVINNVTIDNVSSNSNLRRGILVFATNGGTIVNATVRNSTSNNNLTSGVGRGIEIRADGGTINNAVIQGNITQGNIQNALVASTLNSGLINSVIFENNIATGNTGAGITIGSSSLGYIKNAVIRNNTANNNATVGAAVSADGGTTENVLIENNILNGNSTHGVYIYATTANSVVTGVTVRNNITSGNTQYGIRIEAASTGRIANTLIESNIVDSNIVAGVALLTSASGKISNTAINRNTITNTNRDGLRFQSSSGTTNSEITASVSGNIITGNAISNTYYGLNINNDNTGVFNVDLGGGTLGSTGGNRIHSNVFNDVFIDSMPGTGTTTGVQIKAQHNYWGNPAGLQPGRRVLDGTSTIDASNFLTQ